VYTRQVAADKGDDRHVAQPAHLEELPGLLLDAPGGVEHHDGAVDRDQGAVDVLAEIPMARRVEQVEGEPLVLKAHHRRGDPDAAVALDRHPIGARPASLALPLDLARQLDRSAKQQQFLGQGGLAGVRMRNDRQRCAGAKSRRSGHLLQRLDRVRKAASVPSTRSGNMMCLRPVAKKGQRSAVRRISCRFILYD
jgi:hypothetical protein